MKIKDKIEIAEMFLEAQDTQLNNWHVTGCDDCNRREKLIALFKEIDDGRYGRVRLDNWHVEAGMQEGFTRVRYIKLKEGLYECSKCSELKKEDDMTKSSVTKSGVSSTCKECTAQRVRKYQKSRHTVSIESRRRASIKFKKRGKLLREFHSAWLRDDEVAMEDINEALAEL